MFVGTGTTITLGSLFAEVLDIKGPGLSRESIDKSHLGSTGAKEFMPGNLYDPGELTVEMAFKPGTDITAFFAATGSGLPASCTIVWADSAVTDWVFDAFVTRFEGGAPLEARATASVTLKLTGAIAV